MYIVETELICIITDVCANSLSHSAPYVELLWAEYHNLNC